MLAAVTNARRFRRLHYDVGHKALLFLNAALYNDTLAHRRMLHERGLDFSQLDAEAAHLHLEVEPAEELDFAVTQESARSPVR